MVIHRSGVGVAVIVILLLTCASALAQESTAFDTNDRFSVPAYNGVISFAVNGTYSSATLEGATWDFTDLQLNRSEPLENLQIAVENSDVTVFSYRTTTTGFPNDRLNFRVQGKGKQVINMGVGLNGGGSVDWVVSSNGTFVNSGWSVSRNGSVTLIGLTGNINVIYYDFTGQLPRSNLPFYEQHSVAIAVAVAVAVTVAAAVAVNVVIKRRSGAGGTIAR